MQTSFSREYHSASFNVVVVDGSDIVCYLLAPGGLASDMAKWAEKAAAGRNCNIVVISGMDWNCDMTPWPADGVMKEKKPFSGGAKMYLKELAEDYIPAVEQWLNLKSAKRYLLGISLSGLFAIWAISSTNVFEGVGSISGSLWYDGFVEWMRKTELVSTAKVYMALGVKEKNVRDKRMATVEDASGEARDVLEGKGIAVTFEMVPGTHFSPAAPRLDRAMEVLFAV